MAQRHLMTQHELAHTHTHAHTLLANQRLDWTVKIDTGMELASRELATHYSSGLRISGDIIRERTLLPLILALKPGVVMN